MKRFIHLLLGIATIFCMVGLTGNEVLAMQLETSVDTSIENGKEIFQNFLDVTAFIEDDPTWKACMDNYKDGGVEYLMMKSVYLETVEGATEEKYKELTPYEAFVYFESYVRLAGMVGNSMTDMYVKNEKGGVSQYINIHSITWNGNKVEEVKEAFTELIEWQFAYFRENNFPYNFITDKSYAEEVEVLPVEKEEDPLEQEIKDELGLTDEEIKEIVEVLTPEEVEEVTESAEKEKTGIWVPVLNKLKDMWFTLLILAVFAGAYLVVRHIRKKTDIDELSDSGK